MTAAGLSAACARPGMQQAIDHVKHEKSLHAVVGEALPCLGECDVAEPARVSEKTAVLRVVHR